ncbi:Arf GTPase activating protein [Macleaya cordata]|uniref:Arf GTPase activating protein n=1 Tax=Macleaya cordata TaxID=56857 RepID=A0A200Q1K1_MACCD|nr:Arf GTPase activating protein [Macleaya cordata]
MSSKKEEERNEKIIRGLMKLPPNRRCINCNSLGPQYVCTNFWTFICITCSGIHREFTHRVKSVSMAKFTSQEVDSVQRGGNQRAREMFLKDWDLQRQRLPSSSNAEKVREFIKNVYVDRKFAGGNTSDKPPRDVQSLRNHEDETRRASSYHSYSQSPPYEYQYEDRRYGRQVGVLTRKPGSDRGHYEGKISSFVYSPGRLGEQMYEDRFANEGSVSRVSDYSVSSGGDPFRSGAPSPNFQKDIGVSSPAIYPVQDILVEDARCQTVNSYSEVNTKIDAHRVAHQQRTASLSSFGSFDSNSMSLQSVNSGALLDVVLEPEQFAGTQLERMSAVPSLPQSHVSANNSSLNSLSSSHIQQSATFSAPSIDLFQPQITSSAPSIDLLADITQQQLDTASLEQKQPTVSFADNEGWATFDLPQHEVFAPKTENVPPASMAHGDATPFGNFDVLPSTSANMQWTSVQNSTTHGPFSSLDIQWDGGLHEVQAAPNQTSTEPWNAFGDSFGSLPRASFGNMMYNSEPQVAAYMLPSDADQCFISKVLEDSSTNGVQGANLVDRPPVPEAPFNGVINGSSLNPSGFSLMGGMPSSHATDQKSTNPFDFPYEPDLKPNMFLDMGSLQSALPDPQLQPAFLSGLSQPWFPQDSITPYIPATPQGGLTYMAGEAPTPQLPNIPTQGPVASVGGNPFA